jgi:NAD(P)-dependent dehydrogenase (short-subunit alcohol dehydrogenase family)
MNGRICVVTGATSGIGRATALALVKLGAEVAAVGRNRGAGEALASRPARGDTAGRMEFFRVDLASFEEVRRTAAELRRRYSTIDVLVNNAGARFDHYETNGEGLERTFAVNHLGHFLLTSLLLDPLLASSGSRIVTVASGAHAASVGREWLLTQSTYDRKVAYAVSKLANIMFTYELARRLHGTTVTANAVDPGGVASNLGRNNGFVARLRHLVYYAMRGKLRTPQRAAKLLTRVASAEELRGVSGKYFDEQQAIRSTAISYDRARAAELWELSVKLTGLDRGIGPAWKYVGISDQ